MLFMSNLFPILLQPGNRCNHKCKFELRWLNKEEEKEC